MNARRLAVSVAAIVLAGSGTASAQSVVPGPDTGTSVPPYLLCETARQVGMLVPDCHGPSGAGGGSTAEHGDGSLDPASLDPAGSADAFPALSVHLGNRLFGVACLALSPQCMGSSYYVSTLGSQL